MWLQCAEHGRWVDITDVHEVWEGKSLGKQSLERLRRRLEDDPKRNLFEMVCKNVRW
jgi:hypothetical protein